MDFDDVHILIFALWDLLSCDHITDINNTVLVALVSIVVKEDVLSVVVGLIDEQKFSSAIGEATSLVAAVV